MRPKIKEKEQAIILRQNGLSMREIANELKVSKSSVKLWTDHIPYVPRVSESERRKQAGPKISKTKIQKLLDSDFDSLTTDSKKKRVLLEQEGKCLLCGIDKWRDQPLVLEVDHIDGDNQNNSRQNLRGLCPNCHSQTNTYCGKNRGAHYKKGHPRVTDERLLSALLDTNSMSFALRSVGMTRCRANFTRCKELLQKHNAEHLVDTKCSLCGFCGIEISEVPQEDGQVRFCSRTCAGKQRASVKNFTPM